MKHRRRHRRGRGKVGDWLKNAAKKVGGFLKKTQLVSKLAPVVSGALPGVAGKAVTAVGDYARSQGYGRRRRGRGGKSGYRRIRHFGKGMSGVSGGGTPGMGPVSNVVVPSATSTAVPRF